MSGFTYDTSLKEINPKYITNASGSDALRVQTQNGINILASGSNLTQLGGALDVNVKSVAASSDTSIGYHPPASLSTTSQTIAGGAGILQGIYLYHVGGSQFCYAKFYDSVSANSTSTPIATFGVHADGQVYIDCKNLAFTQGMCVRGTDDYADNNNTNPTGTLYCQVFWKGV